MALIDHYRGEVQSGTLKPDAAQDAVAQQLSHLADELAGRPKRTTTLQRWFSRSEPAPSSIYIYGDVGRGKTMLMDMFYDNVGDVPKQRVHFHRFMQDIHLKRARSDAPDVINSIAAEIAARVRLLCLDEMQVQDIADAMIIGRLFTGLLHKGVVIVTTSNLAPQALYKDGLNRDLFLPSISFIVQNFTVISLNGNRDYRLGRLRGRESFLTPLNDHTAQAFQALWQDLTDTKQGRPSELTVLGRKLKVPEAAHGCARFSFADLCEEPLGPADYLALAQNFQTLFISAIPALKASQRNEAKRFVLLIDTLYDARRRLVATSAKAPQSIYPHGHHSFEFSRTVSRLKEMQSASWWANALVET